MVVPTKQVDFDELQRLFWIKAHDRLKDDKPLSDAAFARQLEYFNSFEQRRLEREREERRLQEQAQRSNPIETIMANTGLPRERRLELLGQERESLLDELKRCEQAIEELL
jgi:hypothetical protein